jgi:hypothetical protein
MGIQKQVPSQTVKKKALKGTMDSSAKPHLLLCFTIPTRSLNVQPHQLKMRHITKYINQTLLKTPIFSIDHEHLFDTVSQ